MASWLYDGIVLKGSSLRDPKQIKGLLPNKAQLDFSLSIGQLCPLVNP